MMEWAIFADWVGALALLTVLSTGCGMTCRLVRSRTLVDILAGSLFALVAISMMHMHLRIADGVIVDMRNVPIALASAFLAVRAAALTLLAAVAMRLWLGGIGVETGVSAMLYTAIMGFVWRQWTDRLPVRHLIHYVLLATMVTSSLWSVILLPTPLALRMLTDAAPAIVALYLVFIPLSAFLLDREKSTIRLETRQRSSGALDVGTGLLTQPAFQRELELIRVLHGRDCIGGIARIRLQPHSRLQMLCGSDNTGQALAALRVRLRHLLRHGDVVGQQGRNALLVPLTEEECENWDALGSRIDHELSSPPLHLDNDQRMMLHVDLDLQCIARRARDSLRCEELLPDGSFARPG